MFRHISRIIARIATAYMSAFAVQIMHSADAQDVELDHWAVSPCGYCYFF